MRLFLFGHLLAQVLHARLVRIRQVLLLALQLGVDFLEEGNLVLELLLQLLDLPHVRVLLCLQSIYLLLVFSMKLLLDSILL